MARVQSHTCQSFHLPPAEGRFGAEVAERLNTKAVPVFMTRSEVQKRVQGEVRKLEGRGPALDA